MNDENEIRTVHEALGQSEVFLDFQDQVSLAAKVERPVLIIGERGSGKELAAARLHFLSPHWQKPYITLNCASLTPTLIESELFGYVEGAFTGAKGSRKGRFEIADTGTLFPDELGLIPLPVQEKILRVVEYGVFEPVGSSKPKSVNVRIIGATNQDLLELVQRGEFKRDLLDRLSFEVLFLPPLRERREDIVLLANHFARRIALDIGRTEAPVFSPAVIESLLSYPWPGNIRELKNVIERAVYKTKQNQIETVDIDPFDAPEFELHLEGAKTIPVVAGKQAAPKTAEPLSLDKDDFPMDFNAAIRQKEIEILEKALQQSQYNQKQAAERIGLNYHQFRWLYKKYKDALSDHESH